MTIKTYLHFVTKVILVLLAVTLSSCNRNVLYTSSKSPDSQNARALDNSENALKAIASDDKISLSIWGHDNLSVGSIHTVYSVQEEAGKWLMVDDKGEVNLPQIGKVKLQGLTIPEATKLLEKEYGKVPFGFHVRADTGRVARSVGFKVTNCDLRSAKGETS